MFYTAYSVPNVVLPFFGGLLADRWGAARCATLCIACITVGQCVVALGVSFQSVGFILFGRVLFGVGGESLCVAISALLQQVFAGAEVGLAMGLNLSVSRLGSVVNNVVSPYLAFKSGGVVAPFWFGAGLCLLSLVASLTLVPMSTTNIARRRQAEDDRNGDHTGGATSGGEASDHSVGSAFSDHDESVDSGMKEDPTAADYQSPNKLKTPAPVRKRTGEASSVLRCSSFGSRFYLMVGSCIVVYGTVLPFNNVASALIIERYICHGQCCPSSALIKSTTTTTAMVRTATTPKHHTLMHNKPASFYFLETTESNPDSTDTKETKKTWTPAQIKPVVKSNVVKVSAVKPVVALARPPAVVAVKAKATTVNVNVAHSIKQSSTISLPAVRPAVKKIAAPPALQQLPKQQCSRAVEAESTASYVMGIPFLVSALMTPIVGLFADRFGGASSMTLAAPIVLVLVHFLLMTTSIVPIFPMVAQGVAYSMYAAALWPLIGRAVRADDVGVAYGVTTALQNIGLATIPPVVAALRVKAGNYDSVEALFIVLSISGVVFGLGLLLVDGTYYKCTLNRPLRYTSGRGGEGGDGGDGGEGGDFKGGKGGKGGKGISRNGAHSGRNGGLRPRDIRRRRLSDYDDKIPPDFFDDQRILEEATSLLEAEGGIN
jgi:MFS family permease